MKLLEDRIWEQAKFQSDFAALKTAWLRRELAMNGGEVVSDETIVKCLQAAAVLAASEDPVRQRVAYSIATCTNDLCGDDMPGIAGALRIVLTRMGNFPAINTLAAVRDYHRLPTPLAFAEESRRIPNEITAGGGTLTLTDFQRRLWTLLTLGSNVAISAPTSAGKSFVLQAYLRELARGVKLKAACYIVPSRALIAQVTDAISAWRLEDQLSDISVINIPLLEEVSLPERGIYVLTQERLQAIMQGHPNFAPEIIVCDEAQSIQEGSRGVLLQNVIDGLLRRNSTAQIVFAGPNIRNLSVFRETFGLDAIEEIHSRSPTVLQNLMVVNTRSPLKGRLVVEQFSPDERTELGIVDINCSLPSIRERLVRVAARFGKSKPSIVYANGPADAENIALGLSEVIGDAEPSDRIDDLVAFVKMAVHKDYDLASCLLRRVGYHYGRIPTLVRRGVEAAFADGEIKYLVTTSTLIQGVNFPAANLFVCQPKKGKVEPLNTAEFWNLAGRAGRLGKEHQGNIFLIDYDTWATQPANEGNEAVIQSSLKTTLNDRLDAVEACALQHNPGLENDEAIDVEATFARLLADHMNGRLETTLARCGIAPADIERLTTAVSAARQKVTLPAQVIGAAPTVSAIRQQRLAGYLLSEIKGGGRARLEELIPRHPRDSDAYRSLSEIYRICHEQLLSLKLPRLHIRMAAISLKWMRGDPLPEIIDENHKRNGGKLAANIRGTLNDIEQEIRFKYMRLASCYISVLGHVLVQTNYENYVGSLSPLPVYLEVGAADATMLSFLNLGLSRVTARLLTDRTMNKEMTPSTALKWLREQEVEHWITSPVVLEDIRRAVANAGP